ncbi:MAG TPA: hypothetical protein VEJ84_07170 [Acidimicrobiales bacterium]|nr:hypothetical protein [Acidimicrobiales bacterium]
MVSADEHALASGRALEALTGKRVVSRAGRGLSALMWSPGWSPEVSLDGGLAEAAAEWAGATAKGD